LQTHVFPFSLFPTAFFSYARAATSAFAHRVAAAAT
jgi:hypothetical protein